MEEKSELLKTGDLIAVVKYLAQFYRSVWPFEHITRVPIKALE